MLMHGSVVSSCLLQNTIPLYAILHLLHHLFLYQGVIVSSFFFPIVNKAPMYISVQYFLV